MAIRPSLEEPYYCKLFFSSLHLETWALRADRIVVVTTSCLYVHVTFSVAYQLYQKRSKWVPATPEELINVAPFSSIPVPIIIPSHPSIKDLPTRRKLLQSLLRLPNFLDLIVLQLRLAFARPWQFWQFRIRMPLIGSMVPPKWWLGWAFWGDSCWTVDGQNDRFRRRYCCWNCPFLRLWKSRRTYDCGNDDDCLYPCNSDIQWKLSWTMLVLTVLNF